jgi:hypothetical protein
MRRRELLGVLGGAAIVWPIAAPVVPVIGFLRSTSAVGSQGTSALGNHRKP